MNIIQARKFCFYSIIISCMTVLNGCVDDAGARQASLKAANEWIQENKLDATATCRYPNPYACDVVPKDPRPNIVLYCDKSCRIAIQ